MGDVGGDVTGEDDFLPYQHLDAVDTSSMVLAPPKRHTHHTDSAVPAGTARPARPARRDRHGLRAPLDLQYFEGPVVPLPLRPRFQRDVQREATIYHHVPEGFDVYVPGDVDVQWLGNRTHLALHPLPYVLKCADSTLPPGIKLAEESVVQLRKNHFSIASVLVYHEMRRWRLIVRNGSCRMRLPVGRNDGGAECIFLALEESSGVFLG